MGLALQRWHLRDLPSVGLVFEHPDGDHVHATRWSPCFRWVHFERPDGQTGCLRRATFNAALWSGPVHFKNFPEVTR
jgi:hypothetical protein